MAASKRKTVPKPAAKKASKKEDTKDAVAEDKPQRKSRRSASQDEDVEEVEEVEMKATKVVKGKKSVVKDTSVDDSKASKIVAESTSISITDIADEVDMMDVGSDIIDGAAKSNRVWKTKQTQRNSHQNRQGVNSRLAKTYEQHKAERAKKQQLKDLVNSINDGKRQAKLDAKERRLEQDKRKAANALKSTSYQEIKGDKLKKMSKKQLRQVRKTSMNAKTGQIELVPVY
jgi:hypothetical protein